MNRTRKKLHLLFTLPLIPSLLFTAYAPKVYAAQADVAGPDEDALLAPYFIIQREDFPIDLFPLKSTEVTTNINGIIAETYVVQTYANEGNEPINARYVFPTASNVTMHGMRMEIGDNVVTAQIKEKEEAKEVYEEAKSEGKSTSLLEQKRPNVFTMDVANIMPGDTARIELHYTQLITPGRLHTLIGIGVYFTALLAVYRLAASFFGEKALSPADSLRKCLPPLFWYFFFTLGIPFLSRTYERDGGNFAEYALLILGCCTILLLPYLLTCLVKNLSKS